MRRSVSRRPCRSANAAATSSASCASRPLATSARGAASPPKPRASDLEQQRAQQVGEDRRRGRDRAVVQQVECARLDDRAVDRGVLERRLDALGLMVEPEHRRPAQPRGGDRQDARAAAEVDARPARLELEQQLQAQARRVVCAGAERLPGVDHEVLHAGVAGGGLPRRAHAQRAVAAAHLDRAMEGAPALVPVVGDLPRRDLDERAAGGRAQVGQRRQLAGRAVDGVLDDVAVLALLDAGRARARAARRARSRRPRAAPAAPGGSSTAAEEAAQLRAHRSPARRGSPA